ncbi:MAG: hypothetical protein DRJ47_01025 [Thermoprotei archaeon]|nr:MAG: hypothetical protein DRJ47_01025 [Thermoprotei archaeon]
MSKKKFKIRILPYDKVVYAEHGDLLADVLIKAVPDFILPCGGRGFCGLCRVKVLKGVCSEPTANEKLHGVAYPYRLACQVHVVSDLEVVVEPPGKLHALTSGVEPTLEVIEPIVETREIDFNRASTPLDRYLVDKMGFRGVTLRALQQLTTMENMLQVKVYGNTVIGFSNKPKKLGLAVDVGTTKIAVYLVDLDTGLTLWESYTVNPQSRYGDDVITRIGVVMKDYNKLKEMHEITVNAIEKLCKEGLRRIDVKDSDILALVAVGNPVMISILLGIDPRPLGRYPFEPLASTFFEGYGSELGFKLLRDCWFYIPPAVSGFIGSDALADLITAEALKTGYRRYLLMDLGTNTEIILVEDEDFLASSAPAGPALEGGHISSGIKAVEGAIYRVRLRDDGSVAYSFYGREPRGLSGSGLISLVAELLRKGLLSIDGRFRGRLALEKNFIVDKERGIRVTQRDIRELQKAKAAISSVWKTLLATRGLSVRDLEAVYVCGSFGSNIDPDDALQIGLLPPVSRNKVYVLGNAAGTGARLILKSRYYKGRLEDISRRMKVVKVAEGKKYMRIWVENLAFG